ncbi:MAG: hypothetical protein K2P77_10865 [Burkholderiaceae bacterium]|nr:hypothetical protein [Burkholderiaceae bacterium]
MSASGSILRRFQQLILIALESYDTLYRRYPGMVNAELAKSVELQRAAIATIADAETKKAIGELSGSVALLSPARIFSC